MRIYGEIPEGQHATVMAREVTAQGFVITPEDVETWDLYIYDLETSDLLFSTLAESSTLMIDLEVVDGWTVDSIGCNFNQAVAASVFGSEGGRAYLFKWILHCTSLSGIGDVLISATVKVVSAEGSP